MACDACTGSGDVADVGRGVGLVPHVGRPERGRQLQEVNRGADAPHGMGAARHHHGEREREKGCWDGELFRVLVVF